MKSLSGLTKLICSHNSSHQRMSEEFRKSAKRSVLFLRMGFRHVLNMLLPLHQQLGMSATLSQRQIPLPWTKHCTHTCQDYWSPLKPPAPLSLDALYPWHVKRCQSYSEVAHTGGRSSGQLVVEMWRPSWFHCSFYWNVVQHSGNKKRTAASDNLPLVVL